MKMTISWVANCQCSFFNDLHQKGTNDLSAKRDNSSKPIFEELDFTLKQLFFQRTLCQKKKQKTHAFVFIDWK